MPDLCGKSIDVKGERFHLHKIVGRGTFGTVYEAVGPEKKKFAVKLVHEFKSGEAVTSLVNELNIMRNLCHLHPNLNSLKSVDYIDATGCAIVLEYAEGGNLYTATRNGTLREESKFRVFWQIVSAIEFLHSRNVCHRDIKPENILLSGTDPENAMLADFGFAKVADHRAAKTSCGSAHYVAPEVLKGSYNPFIADIWSLGVVLYAMYAHRLPFLGRSVHDTLEASATGRFTIPSKFSVELTEVIHKMICLDTTKRITAREIMGQRWWKEQCEKYNLNPIGSSDHDTVEGISSVTTPDINRIEEHIGQAWKVPINQSSSHNALEKSMPTRAETYTLPLNNRVSIFRRFSNFIRGRTTESDSDSRRR